MRSHCEIWAQSKYGVTCLNNLSVKIYLTYSCCGFYNIFICTLFKSVDTAFALSNMGTIRDVVSSYLLYLLED